MNTMASITTAASHLIVSFMIAKTFISKNVVNPSRS